MSSSSSVSAMSRSKSRALNPAELAAFAAEIDTLRARTVATLGKSDADYIRSIVTLVRVLGLSGRALLLGGAIAAAWWPWLLLPTWLAGALSLGLAKIVENMELGHNVIHGQFDWMHDARLDGKTYEWDIVGTSENWRKSHNHSHHTWTNVRGMDDDIGYGLLRLFPEQRWYRFHLFQPLIAVFFALFFQWGVAIQEVRFGRWFAGKMTTEKMKEDFRPVGQKMARQLFKDYVLFPALAGPFFLPVLLGALAANGIRNVWTFTIIFCGHFTADAETFSKDSVIDETRGQWYLRQIKGSSNLSGGRVLNLLSGNLSHQIEHHLFPDVPANRYAAMAVEIRAICARYGQHYNTGSLPKQFGQVVWRILRYALPGGRRAPRAATPQVA